MEEASVAGESPDKSEQQQSSGTTRNGRDPRLDVFREPAPGGAGEKDEPTSGGAGEVAPGSERGARTDAAAERGGAESALKPAEAPEEAPDGPEAAQDAPEAATAGGAPEAVEPDADADADAEAGEPEAEVAASEAGEEPRAEEPEPNAADEPEAAKSEAEVAAPEAGDEPRTGEPETGDEPEEGDARLRAAVAAWVSKADDADGGADDQGESPEEQPRVPRSREEEQSSEPDEKPATEPAARPEADAKSEPSEKPKPDAAAKSESSAEAKAGAEEKPAAEAKASAADGEKPAAGEDAPAVGEDTSAAGDDGPAEAKKPAAAEAKEPAPDGEKPAAGEDAPADNDGPAAQASPPAADNDGPAAEGKKPAAEADAPVDQPTAVFKAPRLPKVDQPTTALKITRSPSGRPVTAEVESPAERTSRFVPLRSDDVRSAPAPRKPESPAPEPGARPAPAQSAALSGAERTRQQPMPPKPPLDLLAELTNTPPPPETPVRTAVRRVKIWTPLVLLLLIVFAIVQMVRPLPDPSLTMTAKSTYSFDGDAPKLPWPDQGQGYMAATGLGKVDSFGEQKPVPIASVAKAMTAYLVLKSHPLKRGENGPDIKIDAKAEADGKLYTEGESTLSTVKEGDVLTERDALAAIMIPSANNIARLLARWEAGSEKAFVAKMNATADELGMKNTTYTDPSGLTASTVSTAEDLVKLGEKLVEFPALMDITKLPEWKDPKGHKWRNYNTLVPYDGALGIKTGSTSKAGGNLLFAAHKMIDGTDQLIVGAILGQYDKLSIIDEVNRVSKKVMLATQDLLEGAKVVRKGDVVGQVDDGMGHTTPVVATKDVKAVGWSGLTVKLELTDDGKTIPHEAVAGTHVGTLTVGEGRSQVKVAVALRSDLAKPSVSDKLTRLG
ncbi:D-alanyl-D-alanine carboxypeptidase [Streptomyces sp. col6]|uniref:D-alanyl-D-alanine carboxypeptidase n=1 Tax=Streptomyces sp. col6 TaxID=2478958 RepID=UPI001CD1198C|nr:serine hydrolase [Streptomyces sp. col6]